MYDEAKEYDFDSWMDLAQTDPEKFEDLREAAIDELIASAPRERQMQLRRLQWRIDMVRQRAGNPMAATIEISKMMWNSFYELRDHFQDMFGDETGGRRIRPEPAELTPAQVIPFRRQSGALAQ